MKVVLRFLLVVAIPMAFIWWMPTAYAALYVYVDESGVPHYALQKLTEQYQLFVNDEVAFSDDVTVAVNDDSFMQAKLPDMSQYSKNALGNNAGMKLANGVYVAQPSKAILNKLLRSPVLAHYEATIHRHARTAGVDPALVKAVMAAESGFNARAVSPKNALGLMQVIPPTAARYGVTAEQLMNPERNIYAGVRYLADLSRMFKGRPDLILAAYNAGEGAVYKYKRQIPPYKETQNYVRTVLQYYSVYNPNSAMLAFNGVPFMDNRLAVNRRSAQRVSAKITNRPSNMKMYD